MEEKRKDLAVEKRKRLLQRLVGDLSRDNPGFYYQSVGEIAFQIRARIGDKSSLSMEDRTLLEPLSPRDIQILLSLS